jgi:DNA-binding transcriptional LysR family regulator
MELRHLNYFVAVAEELHFGRAAQRLGIAQPPLSQQIRKLEEELGVLLFERSTRRQVKLTEAGLAFLREARSALAQAEQAIAAARRAARGQEGQLAVGVVGSITFDILPVILKTFRVRYPNVTLALRELTSIGQAEALRQERLRVGFVRPLADTSGLRLEPLLTEPLVAAVPEGHPLASRSEIDIAEIAREPLILCTANAGCNIIRDLIFATCEKAGVTPQVAMEASQLPTLIGLVAGDLGVALVPASVLTFHRRGVAYRRLRKPEPLIELCLATRDDERSPLVESFLAVAREVVTTERPLQAPGLHLISSAS